MLHLHNKNSMSLLLLLLSPVPCLAGQPPLPSSLSPPHATFYATLSEMLCRCRRGVRSTEARNGRACLFCWGQLAAGFRTLCIVTCLVVLAKSQEPN